jgi:hypothetical protein
MLLRSYRRRARVRRYWLARPARVQAGGRGRRVHRATSDHPPVVLDLALWSDAELLDEELRLWCEMWDGYERHGTTWDGATWERWDLVIKEIHRRRLTPRGEW